MGGGQHHRHLRAACGHRIGRRHLRHQRQQRQLRGGADGQRRPHQDRQRHADAGRRTYTGATTSTAARCRPARSTPSRPSSAFSVASGATLNLQGFNQTIGSLAGAGAVTLGAALADDRRRQHQHDLLRHDRGTGGLTKIGNGMLTLTGANTFTGRDHRQCRQAGRERQPGERRHGNSGGVLSGTGSFGGAGDQRRHPRARQLDRHADRQRQLHRRTAASIRSRSMPPARAIASTSPARRRSTAARCRCWRRPAPTPATPPTRSSTPPAA